MGWLGFVLIGGGVLSVWAGFQGVPLTEVIGSVLRGEPVPRAGVSDADLANKLERKAGPSSGPSGGGGGGGRQVTQ